ncbi:MAG: hypothetical protein IMY75_01155, partial [Chloroflexi bacterium]|nr:hypothetical protein [Chloroflexota bacterium]
FSDGMALHDLWEGGRAQVMTGRIAGMTLLPRSGAVLKEAGSRAGAVASKAFQPGESRVSRLEAASQPGGPNEYP